MNGSQLRPRTVGEMLDGAFRLYLGNARTLIAIVACVVVPLEVISAVLQGATVSHGDQLASSLFDLHLHSVREANGTVRNAAPHLSQGAFWIQVGFTQLVGLLSTAACVRALADVTAGAAPSVAGSLAAAVRRLPAIIGLFVLRMVGLVVGLLALIVPGIWLAGSWSVSVPTLMLEGAGPLHALRRSAHLVRGRWWPVVGVIIVADVAIGIGSAVLQGVFGAIDGSSHPSVFAALLALTLGAIVASLLAQPLNAAVRVVLYLDLRIRQGGEELRSLADQLGLAESIPEPEMRSQAPGPRAPGDPPYWPPPPGWRPES